MAKVVNGREAVMRNLVDVEGELGLDVGMLPFAEGDDRAIFRGQLGKLDRHGAIGGLGVADVVADVMGKRPNGKGKLVGVLGIAEEIDDEVAGADVVGQVREERVAEGIVANVLNDAARIGVGPCLFQLLGGDVGITAAQQRHDGALPGQVDQLLVGQQRISAGGPADKQQAQQKSRGPEEIAHRLQYRSAGIYLTNPVLQGPGLQCLRENRKTLGPSDG